MNVEKKAIRRSVGQMSRFYLAYQLLFLFGGIVSTLVMAVPLLLQETAITEEHFNQVLVNKMGLISLVSISFAAVFVLLKRRKKLWQVDLYNFKYPSAKIKLSTLGICVLLLFAAQAVYMCLSPAVEWSANQLGYTMAPYLELTSVEENTILMLVYASILGPIMEEVVFRGVLLQYLLPHGKFFAISISALLFGCFHGELTQGIFAFICGLVFSYLTIEYSIKWAILLHIFNNFLLSTVLSGLLDLLPQSMNTIFFALISIIGGGCGLFLLWKNRTKVKAALNRNIAKKGTYLQSFTSIWFLLCVGWGLYECIDIFTKISH